MPDSAQDILNRGREAPEKEPVIHSVIFGYGFRARSGKDTAANWVKLNRGKSPLVFEGHTIQRYGFADELKKEVTECALKSGGMRNLFSEGLRMEGAGFLQTNGNLLRLPDWVVYDENPDMSDPLCSLGKQRLFLQWYGGEFRRGADVDYWVKKLFCRIAEEKPEVALVSDLRHLNEFFFCQKYGECVRIDRPDLPPLQGAAGKHASETELASLPDACWSDIIRNDCSLKEFRERALFSYDMLMSAIPTQRPTLSSI